MRNMLSSDIKDIIVITITIITIIIIIIIIKSNAMFCEIWSRLHCLQISLCQTLSRN